MDKECSLNDFNRRRFLRLGAAAGAAAAAGQATADHHGVKTKLALGIDNFAVRAMKWKDRQLVDYAAKLKCDTLFITDFPAFNSLEEKDLKELKKYADDKGVKVYPGSWSICPTSKRFKKDWGTADEHLALGIRVAKALGVDAVRFVLGAGEDRATEGGIKARIDDTVKVLKKGKSQAMDAGVKIAMENHAGDLHSLELVELIEAAGKDFVGANMDSGNASWTLEDPIENLRNLAPYAVTTSLRDSAVWDSDNGTTIQWTAMGKGDVDLKAYFKLYAELCPKCPVQIETISGFNREIPHKKEDFWKTWPNGKPKGFDKFLALSAKGKPRESWKAPEGKDGKLAQQEYQKAEIEESIRYCRETLGLGIRS